MHHENNGFYITGETAVIVFCATAVIFAVSWTYFMGQHLIVGFAEANNSNAVQFLVSMGFKADERGKTATTALHGAVVAGHIGVLESLITDETNIDAIDVHGQTPLFLAAYYGRSEMLRLLVNNGAKLERRNGKCGQTALHIATINNKYVSIKALLEFEFDVDLQDIYGATALHEAANQNDIKSAMLLLKVGARKDIKMGNGMTPAMLAHKLGKTKVLPLLAEEGR